MYARRSVGKLQRSAQQPANNDRHFVEGSNNEEKVRVVSNAPSPMARRGVSKASGPEAASSSEAQRHRQLG